MISAVLAAFMLAGAGIVVRAGDSDITVQSYEDQLGEIARKKEAALAQIDAVRNSRDNETSEAYTLEARRYGHGVGMSQRGAEWMAGYYQKSYQDILNFYYPGMELKTFPEMQRVFHQPDAVLASTAGPAPSPTPRPTPMPLTLALNEGEWYAAVTEISADSSLNLRAEPSLNGEILMRLYKGQELIVSERCAEEGWVRVRMDAIEGYVMESYLTPGRE